jgi:prolyl-tRNA editing enzyme YbaK/EbsC (Cys-tRNA(Pro) deacylase)
MITKRNSIDDIRPEESSWYRTKSTGSVHSDEDDDNNDNTSVNTTDSIAPLIYQRLMKTGFFTSEDEFELVPDYVSKEVVGTFNEQENVMFDKENDGHVSDVKTGVWEVQCYDDDGAPMEPYYIVTGVPMHSRVDTKKLRRALFMHQTTDTTRRRPKLGLAPTETAERLTGYRSGTMMPICHSVAMRLFLEETVIVPEQNRGEADHRILCGSGIFGKCLSISTDTFLQIANANPCGVTVCSLIQNKK